MKPHPSDLLAQENADQLNDPEVMLQQVLADRDLVQHVVRTARDGCESVVGYYRCVFAKRQQRYVLHIQFEPPLSSIPHVEALVTGQSEVRTRVTDRQKFGARIEIILPSPTLEGEELLVEVISTSD